MPALLTHITKLYRFFIERLAKKQGACGVEV